MKYEAEIDGRLLTVELDERDGRITAKIDQRVYELEVLRPEDGVYILFDGDRVLEASVWAAEPDSLRVEIDNRAFGAKVIDRKHRRAAAEHGDEGRKQLVAPMPGKVVRVMLGPGDEVKAGQGVVVVEAMKMQNEIKSPKAGRVVEVRVGAGATVNANQVLAVVE
ncbi:MAG TPA: biotin/lipoyl-containing protein [Blastocatellia bacterium]|nr:biotin/lipoyl-containing protein [Blastocatellia bacterium]